MSEGLITIKRKAAKALFDRLHKDQKRHACSGGDWDSCSITLNFVGGFLGLDKDATKSGLTHALARTIATADTSTCETLLELLQKDEK